MALASAACAAHPAGVPPPAVEHLLQGFASDSCAHRWQAIEEYVDRVIGRRIYWEAELTARLRECGRLAAPRVQQRVRDVTAFADEFRASLERVAKLHGTVYRSSSDRDMWRKSLEPLTKALDDPGTSYLERRLIASSIADSAKKSSAARAAGWDQPVLKMLSSDDAIARLVGSIAAAQGRLLASQAPTKGRIMPVLLSGLDADSIAARYDSARALLTINGLEAETICVDPSDSASDRAAGVRAWRAWWDDNKADIVGTRLPQ